MDASSDLYDPFPADDEAARRLRLEHHRPLLITGREQLVLIAASGRVTV